MGYKVAVSVSSFAEADPAPLNILSQADIEVVPNPHSRRLTKAEIMLHLEGCDGLIAGLEPLDCEVLTSSANLKAIARVGIGIDNVDLEAAENLGIRVSNTPDGPTEAVAEMCLAAVLALSRKLVDFSATMHQGIWQKKMGNGLRGTACFFIGYGRIGKSFAELLRRLGATIYVYDPALIPADLKHGEQWCDMATGLGLADVVTLHASGNQVVLGTDQFDQLKPGAILLNSARGGLIDEPALMKALKNGTVDQAWIDTFEEEPYRGPLMHFSQVLLTPHVSTYTHQCRKSMEVAAVTNLLRDLDIKVGA
ncbi:MAG: hypothetical protein JW786_12195 [Desulfobacterales bacterium]|nr:hypothetical protein [Desulfobacterales bacterium]